MKSFFFLAFVFLISKDLISQSSVSYGQTPILGKLKYGPYAVGFSVLNSEDSTRRMPGGKFRPVQVSVWYPAEFSKNNMVYRDYVTLSANEGDNHTATDSEKQAVVMSFKEFGISVGTPEKVMDQWLSTIMYASSDARQQAGEFPIVIVAQGNFQSAADQAFLCEYIASHGYIVTTTPSPTRIFGPLQSNEDIFPTALDQEADMNFILQKVTTGFHGNSRNMAVLAHSFGARSALIFINQHPEVKAFISLDGGIGNAIGKEWIQKFTDFKPESIQIPILHFYQKLDSNFVIPDFAVFRSLKKSECIVMLIKNMHHYYFSSVGFVAGSIPDFSKNFDPDLAFKCQSYAYYTVQFLNRHVANKMDGRLDRSTNSKFQELTTQAELK